MNTAFMALVAFLFGRILAGGYFLFNAVNHFANFRVMTDYAKSKGTPMPELAVGGSGTVLLLGGTSLILGYDPTIGAILLVIFLLSVTFQMHGFWTVQDPVARAEDTVNFTENIGLLGFLLMTLVIPRPWPFSLG